MAAALRQRRSAGCDSIRARRERRQSGLRMADRAAAQSWPIRSTPTRSSGVLREIFGVSDHDLAVFSEGQRSVSASTKSSQQTGRVSSHLRALAQTPASGRPGAFRCDFARWWKRRNFGGVCLFYRAEEFGDLGRELDVLLAQAAEAEASGLILSEFARALTRRFRHARATFASPRMTTPSSSSPRIRRKVPNGRR